MRHLYYYYLYCAASVSRMTGPLLPFFLDTKLHSRDVERRGHETLPEDLIIRSLSTWILPGRQATAHSHKNTPVCSRLSQVNFISHHRLSRCRRLKCLRILAPRYPAHQLLNPHQVNNFWRTERSSLLPPQPASSSDHRILPIIKGPDQNKVLATALHLGINSEHWQLPSRNWHKSIKASSTRPQTLRCYPRTSPPNRPLKGVMLLFDMSLLPCTTQQASSGTLERRALSLLLYLCSFPLGQYVTPSILPLLSPS